MSRLNCTDSIGSANACDVSPKLTSAANKRDGIKLEELLLTGETPISWERDEGPAWRHETRLRASRFLLATQTMLVLATSGTKKRVYQTTKDTKSTKIWAPKSQVILRALRALRGSFRCNFSMFPIIYFV